MSTPAIVQLPRAADSAPNAAFGVLLALSFSHLLNDSMQALLPALYPLLKQSFGLTFSQIGLITLAFQMTGSVFQPAIGVYTDHRPKPYSLAFGMGISLGGLILLALATGYHSILVAAAMVGLGSAVFHPESSRMARLASGGRHGFAQSLFQVGGNAGTALGPLLAAWIVVPHGQHYILVFTLVALAGMVILTRVGQWSCLHRRRHGAHHAQRDASGAGLARKTLFVSMLVLLALMFSKFFYLASMTNFYTFYLIQKFGLSVRESQYFLFLFLFAGTVGTVVGGIVGDRIGRKAVIWFSILGVSPFSLLLPHANLLGTAALSIVISFVMASAFPAILVYATELLPGKVGLVAGLFFGLAFGLAGIGSAVLGRLADATSIPFVIAVCTYLPLIGLVTVWLPETQRAERR
jgi:FSR family fosmidomycin resistance protein-like MFS transporter